MSRSLRGIVTVVAIVGLASFSGGCKKILRPGSDGDRPPVIISDGSIHLRIIAKTRGSGHKERGTWVLDSTATPPVWFHQETVGAPGSHFVVSVIEGGGACSSPDTDFDNLQELTVTYLQASNSTDVSFKVKIDAKNSSGKGRLAVEGPSTVDGTVPFWLDKGTTGDTLKSVTLGPMGASPPSPVCTLTGGRSQIHVYLRP